MDNAGDIFFGFRVSGGTPASLSSGIARIDAKGNGTWISGTAATGDSGFGTPTMNCAPALSNDQQTVYITVSNIGAAGGYGATGYLVGLDAATLKPKYANHLIDPEYGGNTILEDIGSATPMVGPDGDVYIGVLNSQGSNSRGWMLHFNSTLAVAKTPGAFGWDDTPSVVPSQCVPSYQGPSSYLILTKYNYYAGDGGGNGQNRVACSGCYHYGGIQSA